MLNIVTKMGLIDKITKTKTVETSKEVSIEKPISLFSKYELELLLVLIKSSQFRGDELEKVYNLVLKIQTEYQKYK
jgi:hypothetical protein